MQRVTAQVRVAYIVETGECLPGNSGEPVCEQFVGLGHAEIGAIQGDEHDIAAETAGSQLLRRVAVGDEPGPADADLHGSRVVDPIAVPCTEGGQGLSGQLAPQVIVFERKTPGKMKSAELRIGQPYISGFGIFQRRQRRALTLDAGHAMLPEGVG